MLDQRGCAVVLLAATVGRRQRDGLAHRCAVAIDGDGRSLAKRGGRARGTSRDDVDGGHGATAKRHRLAVASRFDAIREAAIHVRGRASPLRVR